MDRVSHHFVCIAEQGNHLFHERELPNEGHRNRLPPHGRVGGGKRRTHGPWILKVEAWGSIGRPC